MKYTVERLNEKAMQLACQKWNAVAKPLGSLGRLEELVVQLAGIQQTEQVRVNKCCALVFCGDHGVVEEGVSQSGSDVTARVARSIAQGEANINLMAPEADVFAVDMGMLRAVPGTINRSIAAGTQNMTLRPAMSRAQAEQAVQAGIDLAGEMKARGYQLILTGEMGIGNTTSSTALACALLQLEPDGAAGRGAGLSDAGLKRKRSAVRRALALHQPNWADPLDCLSKVGGFEIAGMAGAFLGGMTHRIPVVIDGAISAVAALLAVRMQPEARGFMLPSHRSAEPAALRVLEALGLEPPIQAELRLGEGTGAALLVPLLHRALNVYHSAHTFDSLGMEAYAPQEEQR